MGFYRRQVLPRVMNVVMDDKDLGEIRQRVTSGLSGVVLEVGFGSGLNVPYYPAAVRRVLAVDPATLGRRLAEVRIAKSHVAVEHIDANGDGLPVASESVDYVLVTWTICSLPDPAGALQEMHRALRPGGRLHFAEHGRSPEPGVARWQDRLNPLQRTLAGGCNLNRPVDQLVVKAGFELAHLDNFYLKGPRAIGYMYEGVAVKASPPDLH